MKRSYTLECSNDYDFKVLAINSHSKSYKLCWKLNKILGFDFEKKEDHKINDSLFFQRYECRWSGDIVLNLLANHSKNGCMIASKKSVNYFMIINTDTDLIKKHGFLDKLRTINDILLVFELDLKREKESNRFIIYD